MAPIDKRYKLWYAGRNLSCSTIQDHKIGYAFSSDGINWVKYSGNPVLVPGDSDSFYNTAIYGPSVIFENNIYEMWFTGLDLIYNNQSTDGKANIFFATSNDGVNWSANPLPVLEAGSQNNSDTFVCAEPSVVKINNTYHMFYSVLNQWQVENFQVGYAWSFDGVFWIKSNQNPVLTVGNLNNWDYYWASHPTIIFEPSTSKIRMWYTGRNSQSLESFYDYYWDIGYAEFQLLN